VKHPTGEAAVVAELEYALITACAVLYSLDDDRVTMPEHLRSLTQVALERSVKTRDALRMSRIHLTKENGMEQANKKAGSELLELLASLKEAGIADRLTSVAIGGACINLVATRDAQDKKDSVT
jgi:galactokinase